MLLRKVAGLVKSIEAGARQLQKLVREHPNTQKGVKEAVARIRSDSSLLNTAEIKTLLETACIQGDIRDPEKAEAETQTVQGGIAGESDPRGEAETAVVLRNEEERDEKLEKLSREFNGKVEAIMKAIERIEGGGRRQQDRAETEEPAKRPKKQQKAVQEAQEAPKKKKTMAEAVKDDQGATARTGEQVSKKGEGSKDKEGWETKKGKAFRVRPERVLVETSGSTYADTLRRVKAGVGDKLGAGVKTVRRTQAGNLVIHMEKGTCGEEMVKAIQDVMGDDRAKITRGSKITLEAKGVEEETSLEEVNAAAKKANPTGQYETRAIREYGNGLRIALIEANREDAATLLRIGHIKVGWSRVRIQERLKKPTECSRCLGYGHLAAECKGEDRSSKCRRCNGNGHREKDCREDPVCTLCKDLGEAGTNHFRGSKGCRAFNEVQDKLAGAAAESK